MARDVRQIRIESILGGQSPTSHFGRADQFRASLGIAPDLPPKDGITAPNGSIISGLIRPTATYTDYSDVGDPIMWLKYEPINSLLYAYTHYGSAYSFNGSALTAISDAGELSGTTQGGGLAYYDNYMYFAKDTTIARYGPLNGTPTLNGNYWAGTLAKTQLSGQEIAIDVNSSVQLPNHFLHRHSDGRLYIADIVDNQGTIHYIQTTKTTVEGDTDDGSTYDKLNFGYGLYITSIESYGENLAIALYEGEENSSERGLRAKLGFWDTISDNVNQITWVEFPDQIITAMKNINGILYIVSTNSFFRGFRVTRYVGGSAFEEIMYSENNIPPLPGGIDGAGNRLMVASRSTTPAARACVFSVGLQKDSLSSGLFNIIGANSTSSASTGTALVLGGFQSLGYDMPIVAWGENTFGVSAGLDFMLDDYPGTSNFPQYFHSALYKIGQPFKITKISIPLWNAVESGISIVPKVFIDSGSSGTKDKTLQTIDNTTYPSKQRIVLRPENLTGDNDFWLELKFNGTVLCTVSLPITIEYELIDD